MKLSQLKNIIAIFLSLAMMISVFSVLTFGQEGATNGGATTTEPSPAPTPAPAPAIEQPPAIITPSPEPQPTPQPEIQPQPEQPPTTQPQTMPCLDAVLPSCGSGEMLFTNKDMNGCPVYRCGTISGTPVPEQPPAGPCLMVEPPQCRVGDKMVKELDQNNCPVYRCEYAGFVPGPGEPAAQPLPMPPSQYCPSRQRCWDGTEVACKTDAATNSCNCDWGVCPPKSGTLQPGCRQEPDFSGFTRVVCETVQQQCPTQSNNEQGIEKCKQYGGTPVERTGGSGCKFYDCTFGQSLVGAAPQAIPIATSDNVMCPSNEEIEKMKNQMFDTCKSMNQPLTYKFENGCKIPACGSSETETRRAEQPRCSDIAEKHRDPGARDAASQACKSQNGRPYKDFDSQGCPFIGCAMQAATQSEQYCPHDLPAESYKKCAADGGELVVKKDQNGCISFSDCIIKGDRNRARYVEPIEDIPDEAKLLQLAFKLESLKIQLNDLKNQALDIARYWRSQNSKSAERFELVAGKFDAAQTRVDNAKGMLREVVGKDMLEEENLLDVRREVKKVKEDLKDILYLMLSTDNEITTDIEDKKGGECRDESCSDEAWQFCKAGFSFRPDGNEGPVVTLKGTEEVSSGDVRCLLDAILPEGVGPPPEVMRAAGVTPPISMQCKFPLAIDFTDEGPSEEQLKTYCTGSMLVLMEKFGKGPPGGPGGAPGVPGKCSGGECRNYCPSSPEAAQECLDNLGPYLPAEAKEGLSRIASGQAFGPFGGPGSSGGGNGGQGFQPQQYQRPGGDFERNQINEPAVFEQPGGEFGEPGGFQQPGESVQETGWPEQFPQPVQSVQTNKPEVASLFAFPTTAKQGETIKFQATANFFNDNVKLICGNAGGAADLCIGDFVSGDPSCTWVIPTDEPAGTRDVFCMVQDSTNTLSRPKPIEITITS